MNASSESVFILRLARELGYTKGRLLDEVDSREIAEWLAFFAFEAEEERKRQQEREGKTPGQLTDKIKSALGLGEAKKSGNKSWQPPHRGRGKHRTGDKRS